MNDGQVEVAYQLWLWTWILYQWQRVTAEASNDGRTYIPRCLGSPPDLVPDNLDGTSSLNSSDS